MSQDIRIKKGLNIKLQGKPAEMISALPQPRIFAIQPKDFHGITPKMVVKVGDVVEAGQTVFYSKSNEQIKFASPVAGTITEIKRGEKRRILSVVIESSADNKFKSFGTEAVESLDGAQVLSKLLESGCWSFIKQRPYDVIANPEDKPKAIFVSGFDTAPLASNYDFSLNGKENYLQAAVSALSKLTDGGVHISVNSPASIFNKIEGADIHSVQGKHPAGNVGVQIASINPVNQGERVWTVNAQDLVTIGRLFVDGVYNPSKVVALVGSEVEAPQYYEMVAGQSIGDLIKEKTKGGNIRVISGNVLTGDATSTLNGFLGHYHNEVSVIPEGNHYRFMGWIPFVGSGKLHSASRTSFSWLSNKSFVASTNMNGEERAMVVTGEMEQVMPIDIYPMQLIKAVMANDIEKMESYGIYEVAPEDFALIDYTSSSKIEAQSIIRQGLDLMIKEVG